MSKETPLLRILDFASEAGQYIKFNFQPFTVDDIKTASYINYLMLKYSGASGINPDLISELCHDFFEVKGEKANDTVDIQFFLGINNGGGSTPKITCEILNKDYPDEFSILNLQKKTDSLSIAFKCKTEKALERATMVVYLLMKQSGAFISERDYQSYFYAFKNGYDEIKVKNPLHSFGESIFMYVFKFEDGKPTIKVREN